ncbi:MAG: potassium channel family protein [Gammaproteobacteria bacterium]|nr:potassium channel family protein [Gammaproteobacteria bacterium]MDH4254160.1 potassium channel family protein [Gammaproteobacteria bacterium]MDH5309954.1 potassium channel family protein [Gammaproteobacteria bacterium]
MIRYALLGAALVAVTIVIHGIGTTSWVRYLARRHAARNEPWRLGESLLMLINTSLIGVALHTVQILVWALAYHRLDPSGELQTFETAVYFSFVTFTTLGYGDITLSEGWRLLSGIQALNGILLVGWTTAMVFAAVQRIWSSQSAGA